MSPQAGDLPRGTRFRTVNGRRGEVGELLGKGGQGSVYRVTLDGLHCALKWYHDHYIAVDVGLRTRLERATRRGAPTADFLWPMDLATVEGEESFGYLMPLRAAEFRPMNDLIAPPPRRIELTLGQRLRLCSRISRDFLELHAGGFCYQDINFGNIFLDPASGRVLICDNDNVNIDGADASIYGTRKFMAPEIVRREMLPDSRTDLFSMAVLFFYVLFGWHPLDGRREHAIDMLTLDDEMRLYGLEPRFLFDPTDASNGPVPGFHDWQAARWRALTPLLRQLFLRAFTVGLSNRDARVMESEWQAAFADAADADFACSRCGFEHVAANCDEALGLPADCHGCGEPLEAPAFLDCGRGLVSLVLGREFDGGLAPLAGTGTVSARVEEHPRKPGVRGLRNLSGGDWHVRSPEGSALRVREGQAVRLLPGTVITHARGAGKVRGVAQPVTA